MWCGVLDGCYEKWSPLPHVHISTILSLQHNGLVDVGNDIGLILLELGSGLAITPSKWSGRRQSDSKNYNDKNKYVEKKL